MGARANALDSHFLRNSTFIICHTSHDMNDNHACSASDAYENRFDETNGHNRFNKYIPFERDKLHNDRVSNVNVLVASVSVIYAV